MWIMQASVCFGLNFFIKLSSIRYHSSYRFVLSELARSLWLGLAYVVCYSLPDPSVGIGKCSTITFKGYLYLVVFICIQRA